MKFVATLLANLDKLPNIIKTAKVIIAAVEGFHKHVKEVADETKKDVPTTDGNGPQ